MGNKNKVIVYNTNKNSAMAAAMGEFGGSTKPKKKISEVELKERAVKNTMDALEDMLNELEEVFNKHKDRNYRVKTEGRDYFGDQIVLHVYHDPEDPADIITVYDDDKVLIDYIWGGLNTKGAIEEISREVGKKIRSGLKFKSFVFDPKEGLMCKGTVKQYVYMKWAILDVLAKVYDRDEEIREACGL